MTEHEEFVKSFEKRPAETLAWMLMMEECYGTTHSKKIIDSFTPKELNRINTAMKKVKKDYYVVERIDLNGNYEPSNCRWAKRGGVGRHFEEWKKMTERVKSVKGDSSEDEAT